MYTLVSSECELCAERSESRELSELREARRVEESISTQLKLEVTTGLAQADTEQLGTAH